jgi:multicomponent Na+:H+ antiporter subunit B
MKTIILATAIRALIPLFQVFSLYILFRGHNHPGGGFIGGLVGSIAFVFYIMAYGPKQTMHTYFEFKLFKNKNKDYHTRARRYFHLLRLNASRKQIDDSEHYWERGLFRIEPMYIIAAGLLLAATSGILGFVIAEPYMSAVWADFYLPVIGRPGTPILFDLGVYLLVIGMVLKLTFVLSEE